MVQVNTATPEDANTIRVVFDGAINPTTADDPSEWSVVRVNAVAADVLTVAVVIENSDTEAVLTVHPELSPGEGYLVTALVAEDPGGGDVTPDQATASVPAAFAPAGDTADIPHLPLRSLLNTFGRQVQKLSGAPATRLVLPLQEGDTVAHVETTLSLPTSGTFWADGKAFTYTGRTDGSLTGLAADRFLQQVIPAGTLVVVDARTAPA